MRCKICNNRLSSEEIKYSERYKEYNPCYTCKEASAPTPMQERTDMEILEAMSSADIDRALEYYEA